MLRESTGAIKYKVLSPEEQNRAEPKPMFKNFLWDFQCITLPFI
jgi:hypothetical protein